MREDQRLRLQDLAEKLAEVVLEEADPDNWPGAGQAMDTWTPQVRGDRYWSKKNAAASFMLLTRAEEISKEADAVPAGTATPEQEADMDKEIAKQEKKANDVLNDVLRRTRKGAFDAKTHGKA